MTTTTTTTYRAYDTVTEWAGPARTTADRAARDARAHDDGCRAQGGYGSAIVITADPDAPGRAVDLDGHTVWPPHGRGTGSVRFRAA